MSTIDKANEILTKFLNDNSAYFEFIINLSSVDAKRNMTLFRPYSSIKEYLEDLNAHFYEYDYKDNYVLEQLLSLAITHAFNFSNALEPNKVSWYRIEQKWKEHLKEIF